MWERPSFWKMLPRRFELWVFIKVRGWNIRSVWLQGLGKTWILRNPEVVLSFILNMAWPPTVLIWQIGHEYTVYPEKSLHESCCRIRWLRRYVCFMWRWHVQEKSSSWWELSKRWRKQQKSGNMPKMWRFHWLTVRSFGRNPIWTG